MTETRKGVFDFNKRKCQRAISQVGLWYCLGKDSLNRVALQCERLHQHSQNIQGRSSARRQKDRVYVHLAYHILSGPLGRGPAASLSKSAGEGTEF